MNTNEKGVLWEYRQTQKLCQNMVERSVGIIMALVPYIGYEGASKLAKEVLNSNKTVPEIISEKSILTPEEIEKILSPKNMTEPRSTAVKREFHYVSY